MACWQHRYNLVVVVTSADPTVWRCRWQREIDFNALNGVNLPLAFTGQGGGGVRQLVCAWWQVVSRVDLLCFAALVVGSHELEYIWSQGWLCWRCLSGWLVVWSLTRRTRSSVQVIRVDGARSRATLCWTSLSGVGVSPPFFLPAPLVYSAQLLHVVQGRMGNIRAWGGPLQAVRGRSVLLPGLQQS